MATTTKRPSRYQVRIRIKGQDEQSASFTKRGDAVRWASSTEAAIREQRYFKTGESHSLAELIDKYIREVIPGKGKWARITQAVQLAWWRSELGSKTLSVITPTVLAAARDKLLHSDEGNAEGRKRGERPKSNCDSGSLPGSALSPLYYRREGVGLDGV